MMLSFLLLLVKIAVAAFLAVKLVVVALAGAFVGAASRALGHTERRAVPERQEGRGP